MLPEVARSKSPWHSVPVELCSKVTSTLFPAQSVPLVDLTMILKVQESPAQSEVGHGFFLVTVVSGGNTVSAVAGAGMGVGAGPVYVCDAVPPEPGSGLCVWAVARIGVSISRPTRIDSKLTFMWVIFG